MTRQERARHALERHLRREVMERIKKRLDDRIGQGCSYAEIEFFVSTTNKSENTITGASFSSRT